MTEQRACTLALCLCALAPCLGALIYRTLKGIDDSADVAGSCSAAIACGAMCWQIQERLRAAACGPAACSFMDPRQRARGLRRGLINRMHVKFCIKSNSPRSAPAQPRPLALWRSVPLPRPNKLTMRKSLLFACLVLIAGLACTSAESTPGGARGKPCCHA
jgi:hypothetical protein